MSRDEEHDVAVRFLETRDETLAERLVNANLRLVVKLALEYRASRRDLTDLIQEGNLGLVHAVTKYDPNRGIKLSTYAAWWIRAYILKFIVSNARIVKIGTTRVERKLFFAMGRACARLGGATGAEVGPGDVAAALSVPEGAVVDMQNRMSSADASLETPTGPADGCELGAFLADDVPAADKDLEDDEVRRLVKRRLRDFGRQLSGRERVIFRRRLLCEKPDTMAVVARECGVSPEWIRQLEIRLKTHLRAFLEATLGDSVTELGG
jgi:RNA polymerase sigma-32 factor